MTIHEARGNRLKLAKLLFLLACPIAMKAESVCTASANELRKQTDVMIAESEVDRAEQLIRQCLDVWSKTEISTEADALGAKAYLGLVLSLQGRFEEAEGLLKEAYDRAVKTNSTSRAVTAAYLGALYRYRGDTARALPLLRAAAKRFAELRGPDDPSVAMTLVEMGAVYGNEGRYTMAESTFLEARRILEKTGPSQELTSCDTYIASVQIEQGKYREAEARLAEVMKGSPADTALGKATRALTLYQTARVYRLTGRVEAAKNQYQLAIDAYEKSRIKPFPALVDVVKEYAAFLKQARAPEAPVWAARARGYSNSLRKN